METLEQELQVAKALALDAGHLAVRHRQAGLTVELKAADDPVTAADREASALILAGLRAAFPADVCISEEAADDPARLDPTRRVWYIDPIDGTRDFIAGFPGFAAMIGLVVAGRPRLGVIYQPTGDRLFFAAEGRGAWITDPQGTRPMRTSTIETIPDLRLVVSQSHRSKRIDRIKRELGITREHRIGSIGVKIGLIALGEQDLYISASTKSNAWDTCAPEAIITEAGGRFTDIWGRPLRYDDPDIRNRQGLLASNGRVHDPIARHLKTILPPQL